MIESVAAFDARVLQWLYEIRDPSLVTFFTWVTQLGRSWVVYALAASLALLLVVHRKYAYAAGLIISVVSSGVFVLLLKGIFARARPDASLQSYIEIWYSFPSAHAGLAIALYGFVAYFAWHMLSRKELRIGIFCLALLAIVGVSFSRLYLGVHYTSDVVAGLMVGAFSLYLGVRWARFAHTT